MTHDMAQVQNDTMPDLILYPRDTVMRALEVMHRHGVLLLPVVDERRGEVLGHVSEEELRRLGNTLPLVRMTEILNARAALALEGIAGAGSESEAVSPSERTRSEAWLH